MARVTVNPINAFYIFTQFDIFVFVLFYWLVVVCSVAHLFVRFAIIFSHSFESHGFW